MEMFKDPPPGRRRASPRRLFVRGFLVGVVLPVPAVVLALLFPFAERLLPFLTPGGALLRPLSSVMAGWPGGLNVLLASLANGLVGGLLVLALALLLRRARPSQGRA